MIETLHFRFDLGEPLLSGLFGLLGELPCRELQLPQPPLDFVDLGGNNYEPNVGIDFSSFPYRPIPNGAADRSGSRPDRRERYHP